MDKALTEQFISAGFTEDDVALIEEAEAEDGAVVNWSSSRFTDLLGAIPGVAAEQVIRRFKTSVVEESRSSVLPEKPPYLDTDVNGSPIGYDPSDPSQFWTDPKTGEMWRWDGKRQSKQEMNLLGIRVQNQRFPYGEPHPVVAVRHTTVDGVRVPDPDDVRKAKLQKADWFHIGLGTWMNGIKKYRDVSPEKSRQVKAARERAGIAGNPVIQRA